jgi:hypothetical protein
MSSSLLLFPPKLKYSHTQNNNTLTHNINIKCNENSDSCGTPPTTPLTPLDELALKRHRFFANLIDAAQSAITNNQIRFDQLASSFDATEDNNNNSNPGENQSSTNSNQMKLISSLLYTKYVYP